MTNKLLSLFKDFVVLIFDFLFIFDISFYVFFMILEDFYGENQFGTYLGVSCFCRILINLNWF